MMDPMTASVRTSSGGYDLELRLDRAELLPGRLVDGTLHITAQRDQAIRGARVTLGGTERWRYDRTTTDADGHTRTETVEGSAQLPPEAFAVLGPTTFAAGETREVAFQLPVPGLGPATFEATELGVEWQVRANLDVGGLDPSVGMVVRVLQPTALLRAGVVDVAEFALYPEAHTETEGFAGSIWLDPSPLCIGAPFKGRITLEAAPSRKVQEVRLELRVRAKATVGGGRAETITMWSGVVAGPGDFGGAQVISFEGELPERWLPTIETEHGRADAAFHVIIATAFARDPHLIRDVAVCSTTEL